MDRSESPNARLDASPEASSATKAYHALAIDDAVRDLQTDLRRGLTDDEAAARRQRYGLNELSQQARRSWLAILVDQFKSLIIGLLAAATAVAMAMGEHIEALAIVIVIVINSLIGFFTEWKAEQALLALRQQAAPTARVLRAGAERTLPAVDLVPGDIVLLAAGDRAPADGRIVESRRLQADEAALTGESQPVAKQVDVVAQNAALGDRKNMAYLGTTITDGRGLLLISATGMATEMGHIGKLVAEAGDRETPLEIKLARLGRLLVFIVLGLCAVIVVAGLLRGMTPLYILEIGISLAIAAVPEGLPAVATMTLALGMQRMARKRALVRRLSAVETLGSTTVICSDKTGTLTRNEMTARVIQLDGRRIEVTGAGYDAQGEFREMDKRLEKVDEHLKLALRIGVLCADARVEEAAEGERKVHGDPTEAALLVAAEKAGLKREELENAYPRVAELPFSSESKRMATVHRTPEGTFEAYVKGAPGAILGSSRQHLTHAGIRTLTDEKRKEYLALNEELAAQALRVLALAYRDMPAADDTDAMQRDYVFVGLVGMIDPLRDEAKEAIALCREAGIRVIMMTGDQKATAAEIGRQLGLDRDAKGHELKAVHADALGNLNADAWRKIAQETSVFARVSPEHKLRIVEALENDGEVVAVTGDGVNDAPALKKADIGIAMGIKGTEVAKEASDMVILDDNFATIVAAVDQGRVIFANIIRFIHYLFSCNFSEILVVFFAIMVGWPLPLAALQILWLNLITDVFPALALALEPSSPDAMKRPPRNPDEPLLGLRFMGLIAWQGLLLAATTLTAFALGMHWYGTEGPGLKHAVTLAFMTLALAQVVHAFNARSQKRSIFTRRLFTNGWLWSAVGVCIFLQLGAVYAGFLQDVLQTTPLTATDWAVIVVCTLVPVAVVEAVKVVQTG